jgi:hypothetical protein
MPTKLTSKDILDATYRLCRVDTTTDPLLLGRLIWVMDRPPIKTGVRPPITITIARAAWWLWRHLTGQRPRYNSLREIFLTDAGLLFLHPRHHQEFGAYWVNAAGLTKTDNISPFFIVEE